MGAGNEKRARGALPDYNLRPLLRNNYRRYHIVQYMTNDDVDVDCGDPSSTPSIIKCLLSKIGS
jgi:hypothetical protein